MRDVREKNLSYRVSIVWSSEGSGDEDPPYWDSASVLSMMRADYGKWVLLF